PRTGTAATAGAGVSLRDRDRQRERHGQDNGQCPNNSARALREIHVFFLSPQDGEAPLRWAQMPKSEAIIGSRGCGPQSRGCDDLAGVSSNFGGWRAPSPAPAKSTWETPS